MASVFHFKSYCKLDWGFLFSIICMLQVLVIATSWVLHRFTVHIVASVSNLKSVDGVSDLGISFVEWHLHNERKAQLVFWVLRMKCQWGCSQMLSQGANPNRGPWLTIFMVLFQPNISIFFISEHNHWMPTIAHQSVGVKY